MISLENKIALVTGASGGLGNYVVEAFLAAGATVAGVSRRIQQSDFDSPRFHAIPAELSSLDAAKKVVDQVKGLGGLDTVVHVMGGWAGGKKTGDIEDAEFDQMLDINLRSAFHVFRAAIPALRESRGGSLIAIGSRAVNDPVPNMAAYAASKAALASLVESIAREYRADRIRANIVLPGTMDTPANRKNMPDADFSRWVDPARVASLIALLASDAGADMSGAAVPVYDKEL